MATYTNIVLNTNALLRTYVAAGQVGAAHAARFYCQVAASQWNCALLAEHHAGADSGVVPWSIATIAEVAIGAMFRQRSMQPGRFTREWLAGVEGARRGRLIAMSPGRLLMCDCVHDGSDRTWDAVPRPEGEPTVVWQTANPALDVSGIGDVPHWGKVRTWFAGEIEDWAPLVPPPTPGSSAYDEALDELLALATGRTAEQETIALMWNDGRGTYTPSGHWNAIAADIVTEAGMSDREQARVFAGLNMALHDASVAMMRYKYTYWVPRPSHVAEVNPLITVPNHPSYVSGHSTFSGAASEYLAAVFPDEATYVRALAQQASDSRVYAGIHFRFDCAQGLLVGQHIGQLAAQWYADPQPINRDRVSFWISPGQTY